MSVMSLNSPARLGTVCLTVLWLFFCATEGVKGQTLLDLDSPVIDYGGKQIKPPETGEPLTVQLQGPQSRDVRVLARNLYHDGERLRKQQLVASLPEAIEKLEEALRLWQSVKDQHGTALALNELGLCYVQIDEIPKAMAYYRRALPIWRAEHDQLNEATTLRNIGALYLNLSEYSKALEHFNESLKLAEVTRDEAGQAYTLQKLGLAYSDLGEYPRALDNYQQSLRLWQKIGDQVGEGATYNNLGFLYYLQGRQPEALAYYKRGLILLEDNRYLLGQVYILNNLARIYNELRQKQLALNNYQRALALSRKVGERRIEAIILCNIGVVHLNFRESRDAVSILIQALLIQNEIGHKLGEGRTLGLMMSAWSDLRKPRLAIFYGKQAINQFQEIRQNIQSLDKDTQRNFLRSKQDIYRELAELLITERRLPEAQQVLDMLKEDEYSEFIRRDAATSSPLTLRSQLTPQETTLGSQLQEFGEALTAHGKEYGELRAKKNRTEAEDQHLNELFSELTAANQRFQQFLDQLTIEFGNTADARERIFNIRENQSLMDTLRVLGNKVVVLYTIVLKDKYRVIVITPDVQVAREYPISAAALSRKVLSFLNVVRDPKQDPVPRAKELYKILLGPVEKDLEGLKAETVMWSLDDVLRYLPIAALHDDNDYLVKRYRNVVYTPASRDNLRELSQKPWRGIAFGVSKAGKDFDGLPFVPVELNGIIRQDTDAGDAPGLIPGLRVMDDDFTEDAMQTALLRGEYQLVHIASHFKFQPGDESESYLLLGKGAHLTVSQIKSMPNVFAGVDMLTLSACNTAVSAAGANGKEVEGFAVLAQRQGARSVIASLWEVADASTGFLMLKFYQLENGDRRVSKAEALQKAQLALLNGEMPGSLESGKDHTHPFFWAPFVVIGNWR